MRAAISGRSPCARAINPSTSAANKSHSPAQSRFLRSLLMEVRWRLRRGFMLRGKSNLACFQTGRAAQPIDEAAIGNCDQPRAEGSFGIVSMADHVNGQQQILHGIFYVA